MNPMEDCTKNEELYDDFRRQLKSTLEKNLFDHSIAFLARDYIEPEKWDEILTFAFEKVTQGLNLCD